MGYICRDTTDIFSVSNKVKRYTDIVVASPKYFNVEYNINPHMGGEVNKSVAIEQWNKMKEYLGQYYNIHTLNPDSLYSNNDCISTHPSLLPDLIFSANYWIPFRESKDGVFISRFANKERKREVEYITAFLEQKSIPYVQSESIFEGQGDFLWQDTYDIVWAGYGIRTEYNAIEEFSEHLSDEIPIIPLELNNQFHYHLDTCLKPLSEDVALVVKDAFTDESLQLITSAFETIVPVPKNDFSCNSVMLTNSKILFDTSHTAQDLVGEYGFQTESVNYSEFMKAGGSVACSYVPLSDLS